MKPSSLPLAVAISMALGACSTTQQRPANPPTPPAWLLETPKELRTLPPSKPSPKTTPTAGSGVPA